MAVAFGRYELLKKIASGGMGQVFLARTAQQGFQKLVVIKRILPHLIEDEEFRTMFEDETRLAASLNHPNLVQIFDQGEAGGSLYLAMEYVAGDDVRRLERTARRKGKELPLGVILRVIADAAAGLDYAHKATDGTGRPLRLVHRDVSPQNVLVGFDGGVKLIDFGVARAASNSQRTATGILKGKYPYMSPEQIAGLPYDHTSDQFALGTVFWELLTGKRLFKGESDLVTMRLVRECKVPAPSSINPNLPRALDAVVLRALAPIPTLRFRDTGELRMAIEELAVQERLSASPAHLAAFMRELYADRIAAEADISSLDELSGSGVFNEQPGPGTGGSGSTASRQLRQSQLPAGPQGQRESANANGPVQPPTRVTRPLTVPLAQAPRPTRNRAVLIGAGIAAVALLAAGAAVVVPRFLADLSGESSPNTVGGPVAIVGQTPSLAQAPDEQPAQDFPVMEIDPVELPVVAAPAPVRVSVTSQPEGAQVLLDGKSAGTTPLELTLPEGAAEANVTLTLAGYEPSRLTLSAADADKTLSAVLKKRRAGNGSGQNRPKEDRPPLEIKTGR